MRRTGERRSYSEYVERARSIHGSQFDDRQLARKFIRYYESGERVKVQLGTATLTGTIRVTTGWRPCFLLMRTSHALGSSITLSDHDRLIAVQQPGGRYVELTGIQEAIELKKAGITDEEMD